MPLTKNTTNLPANTTTNVTTERIQVATIPPEFSDKNMNLTLREIKRKRLRMQVETLLNSNRSVADYLGDSDLDALTRRFDKLVEEHKMIFPTKTRREVYDDKDNKEVKRDTKRRLMNLMTHFVYITRYKLVFPQVLKKKYIDSPIYKIGFLFGLLRHLKNMQKWIYWALDTNGSSGEQIVGTLMHDLKLYEKITRIDVDIKDVILLIQKWQYRGNIESNVKYYDYSLEIFK